MARWDSEEDIDEKESAGATRAKSENVAEIDNFIAPRVNRPARRRSA